MCQIIIQIYKFTDFLDNIASLAMYSGVLEGGSPQGTITLEGESRLNTEHIGQKQIHF